MPDGPIVLESITEVRCPTTQSFGSGYLVRAGLVLTACHVIDDTGKDLPSPIKIEVRPLGDGGEGEGWRNAALIWPTAQEWRRRFRQDIALLQFRPDAPARTTVNPVRLGWGNLPIMRPIAVTAVGFPRFKQGESNTRDSMQIVGEVAPLSGIKAQEWDVEYRGRQPRNQEDWRGLSGAALFAGDRLVGIISRKVRGETDFQAGIWDFKAVRLEPALEDSRFRELIVAPGADQHLIISPKTVVREIEETVPFYSCFISYSARDQMFVNRLHADLRNKGVRCWFAPHDLPIGAKTWDAIDEAIHRQDKLLVVLSKASLESGWVEDEVSTAYAEERSRKQIVLFPIRIDNAVMSTVEPWAVKLRDQRNIGDFRQWKRLSEYQKSLERLLRDLRAATI